MAEALLRLCALLAFCMLTPEADGSTPECAEIQRLSSASLLPCYDGKHPAGVTDGETNASTRAGHRQNGISMLLLRTGRQPPGPRDSYSPCHAHWTANSIGTYRRSTQVFRGSPRIGRHPFGPSQQAADF